MLRLLFRARSRGKRDRENDRGPFHTSPFTLLQSKLAAAEVDFREA